MLCCRTRARSAEILLMQAAPVLQGGKAMPRTVMSVFKGCGRKIPLGLLSRLRSLMQACAVEGGH